MFFFCLQAQEKYTTVEIPVSYKQLDTFHQLGFPTDCEYCEYKRDGVIFEVTINAKELAMLKKKRFSFRIVHEDAAKFYASRAKTKDVDPEIFRKTLKTEMKLGSMAGFYTLKEVEAKLDELYEKYKKTGLITKKKSIGKSYEKRDIYFVKISDNATKDESKVEPQVLYTALTHAREPAGMMTVIYFMHYLLENYETDQRVKNIVDNKELFFIPVVNPDGYAYNEKTNPNGGGMLRKNRNGVDLNRNFGPEDLWDYPNGGSGTSEWSSTYRGKAPFSEPEAKAFFDFIMAHNFKTNLNYHTYSNLLIYPWGIKDETADSRFITMAKEMTKINGYRTGTAPGLLYAVRGVTDDSFYKAKGVFAMTPEVGSRSDGFWPRASRIFPLAQENLEMNLLLAEYAGTLIGK